MHVATLYGKQVGDIMLEVIATFFSFSKSSEMV